MAGGVDAAFAGHGLDRVAGDEADEEEGQQRDADEGRDDQAQPCEDEAQHGSADVFGRGASCAAACLVVLFKFEFWRSAKHQIGRKIKDGASKIVDSGVEFAAAGAGARKTWKYQGCHGAMIAIRRVRAEQQMLGPHQILQAWHHLPMSTP
ncbi:MAG: hypothetical protein LCH80_06725 [Proteobacteria bacterium]|nr:hypothetical protein [Pseudomonadota bacterium]